MGFTFSAAAAHACTPELTVLPGNGLDLVVSAPCAPYETIDVRYGQVQITEEISAFGTVIVFLPVLEPGVPLSVDLGDQRVFAEVPDDLPTSAYIWLKSDEHQPKILPTAGFPSDKPSAEMMVYRNRSPEHLDLEVTDELCEQTVSFDVVRESWVEAREMTVQMPSCALSGHVLRLPLPLR